MAETLFLPQAGSKEEIYQALLPQVEALISGEQDLVANLANIAAALREAFGFFWVGFYVVQGQELVLGPFQGPHCLHAYYFWKRGLWDSLERKENAVGARCGGFSRSHCLQLRVQVRNRRASISGWRGVSCVGCR